MEYVDIIIVLLTWGVTALLKRIGKGALDRALPFIATLVATAVKTASATWAGSLIVDGSFQWSVLFYGLMAGGMAVLVHSQFREMVKVFSQSRINSRSGNARLAVLPALFVLPVIFMAACPKSAVVHKDIYAAELAWLEARNVEQQATLMMAVMSSQEDRDACLVYAEAYLMAKYAIGYRIGAMRSLAFDTELQLPPEIPLASSLCVTP